MQQQQQQQQQPQQSQMISQHQQMMQHPQQPPQQHMMHQQPQTHQMPHQQIHQYDHSMQQQHQVMHQQPQQSQYNQPPMSSNTGCQEQISLGTESSSLSYSDSELGSLISLPLNSGSLDLDVGIGEARTSMSLTFEEKGLGVENQAVNETILESCNNQQDDQSKVQPPPTLQQQQPQQAKTEMTPLSVKTEPGLVQPPSTPVTSSISVKVESDSEESNCRSKKEEPSPTPSEIARQNVLLKQLLQNCPSADSSSGSTANTPTPPVVTTPVPPYNLVSSAQSGSTNITEAATAVGVNVGEVEIKTCAAASNGPETLVTTLPANANISPTLSSTFSSLSPVSNTSVNANLNVNTVIPDSVTPQPQQSQPVTNNMTSSILPNDATSAKRMSYLDIRRAQLEREPTPPPEAPCKPKRKRAAKRKESNKDSLIMNQGNNFSTSVASHNQFPSTGTTTGPAPQKKRIRKGSNVKSEVDYDSFIAGITNQLLQMPQLQIIEPDIGPNYNVCPVYGSGDLNSKIPLLKGSYGSGIPIPSKAPATQSSSNKHTLGFYAQEFCKGHLSIQPEKPPIVRNTDSPNLIIRSPSPPDDFEYNPNSITSDFKIFKVLDENQDDNNNNYTNCPSPIIPLHVKTDLETTWNRVYPPICTPPEKSPDPDLDKENSQASLFTSKCLPNAILPLKESGNVAVTLTISSEGEIKNVLGALAKLLEIDVPIDYQILARAETPPNNKMSLLDTEEQLGKASKFCKFCTILIMSNPITKKASDFILNSEIKNKIDEDMDEDDESECYFCGSNCLLQYAVSLAPSRENEKSLATLITHGPARPDSSTTRSSDIGTNLSPLMEVDEIDSEMDKAAARFSAAYDPSQKKWKGIRYKEWKPELTFESASETASTTVVKKSDPIDIAELNKLLDSLPIRMRPEELPPDERRCAFCDEVGDGETNGPARLLNMDINKWVHLNCALWSTEVYETVNGALMQVDAALSKALSVTCVKCSKLGASLRCFKTRCCNFYHLSCAQTEKCLFLKDKGFYCPSHAQRVNVDSVMDSLEVFRRVYVNRDEHKLLAQLIEDQEAVLRIGSMILLNFGQLLPQQLNNFHSPSCIYPVGFKIARFYWSTKELGKRKKYICSIIDEQGHPQFTVEVGDRQELSSGEFKLIAKESSPKDAVLPIVEAVAKMHQEHDHIKVFLDQVTGEDFFGLSDMAVVRILESMPGVDTLHDYQFKFGRTQLLELPLAINPSGCARTEPKLRTHFKRPHSMHTVSRSSVQGNFPSVEIHSPYIKQFIHTKSSQYKRMKSEWRNMVFLARSRIAGLGLYAARDIEKHSMVIEYVGQLIRNELAERMERLYEQQVSKD